MCKCKIKYWSRSGLCQFTRNITLRDMETSTDLEAYHIISQLYGNMKFEVVEVICHE